MTLKWLTLTIILEFMVVHQSQSAVFECNIPNNFSVEMSRGIRSTFFDSYLQIFLDLDAIEFYSYHGSNLIHIKANNISIEFESQKMDEISIDGSSTVKLDVKEYSLSLLDQISGIAEKKPIDEATSLIYNCRLILLPDLNMSSSAGKPSNAIRRIAESCIEHIVSVGFKKLKHWQFIERVEDSICLQSVTLTV